MWSWLQDHYDVKLPCHLLLAKLASAAPGQLLSALDRLVDPLEKTLTARVKTDAVKQEVCPPPRFLCSSPVCLRVKSQCLPGLFHGAVCRCGTLKSLYVHDELGS